MALKVDSLFLERKPVNRYGSSGQPMAQLYGRLREKVNLSKIAIVRSSLNRSWLLVRAQIVTAVHDFFLLGLFTFCMIIFSDSTMNFSTAARVLGHASRSGRPVVCCAVNAAPGTKSAVPVLAPTYSRRLISMGAARLSAAALQPEPSGRALR